MNRASLADAFASLTRRSSWKTFVLESHAGEDEADLLADAFGNAQVRGTDDVHLHDDVAPFVVDQP